VVAPTPVIVTKSPTIIATAGFDETYEIVRPEDATAVNGKESSLEALSTRGGKEID
jgi:hypothetical protein